MSRSAALNTVWSTGTKQSIRPICTFANGATSAATANNTTTTPTATACCCDVARINATTTGKSRSDVGACCRVYSSCIVPSSALTVEYRLMKNNYLLKRLC